MSDAESLRSSRSIQEFHIDLLLKEEFCANPEFAARFLGASGCGLQLVGIDKVVHSLNDAYGEADLLVRMNATDAAGASVRVALLIEDKIDASFQPGQALRYGRRGTAGEGKDWDRFRTALVAPQAYIHDGHGFDAAIALESMKPWFCPTDSIRGDYKRRQIDDAIARHAAKGVQVVDPAMTAFRRAYFDYLEAFNRREEADFTMRPPADTWWGDYWFDLRSRGLHSKIAFRHRPYTGEVEMTFRDTSQDLCSELTALLDADMRLVRTGVRLQHATVRIAVPQVATFDDFHRDRDQVEQGLLGAARLLRLARRERAAIEGIFAAGTGA